MSLSVDRSRIQWMLEALAKFHEPGTLYTRRSFTSIYQAARQWLVNQMGDCGLQVSIDAAGNLIGRLEGTEPGLPALMTGSHIDTVENGGRFDGTVGFVAGLEVIRALADAGMRPRHAIEVVDFLAEEPSAFGLSTVGSRGMAGRLTADMLQSRDSSGRTLLEAIREMGGRPEVLTSPLRQPGEIAAFLEMHIEQGPVLENRRLDVGVVTGIAGIHRHRIRVDGLQGHAGTVPMDLRRDALVAAARMVDAVRNIAKSRTEQGWCVATVGELTVEPNHANVIPGRVTFTLEIRALEPRVLEETSDVMQRVIAQIAHEENCEVVIIPISQSTPVLSHEPLMQAIEASADELGYAHTRLPSGAGHDAAQMASLVPMAMIFIPCRGGISHHPEEFATYEQIARGIEVLGETILKLDHQLGG
ncbi:Zn-dependent hydrolase [Alicyclobacillus kakegawensis]|uniref:Zn-dependent hydrolase n=1 Tax=Alicyclobacillus kakegawensis TaxID=392012 RepID=UPI00082AE5A5|nr:Zn-dependent hydrolase [Alicyclobacillus kakegawensis]